MVNILGNTWRIMNFHVSVGQTLYLKKYTKDKELHPNELSKNKLNSCVCTYLSSSACVMKHSYLVLKLAIQIQLIFPASFYDNTEVATFLMSTSTRQLKTFSKGKCHIPYGTHG